MRSTTPPARPPASAVENASRRTPRRRRPRQKRLEQIKLSLVRRTFPALGRISVDLASRWAERLFRTPPRSVRLPAERRALRKGEPFSFSFRGRRIAGWRWGDSPRSILLVHGWGGHAGRLAKFVEPLIAAGFSVVALDAPAHGDSGGRQTGLPDIARCLLAAEKAAGPFAGAIGHSAGAAACVLAIREGLDVSRAVLLAPTTNPEEFSGRFARALRIPAEVHAKMKERLERHHGWRWPHLRLVACVPDRPVPLLIFHDEGDHAVRLRDGEAIVRMWRGATIVRTRGLGHHKILRDPAVIASSAAFLAAPERREALPAGA
jgi:pimeloyl-ACP methyl ester carboxylesterase